MANGMNGRISLLDLFSREELQKKQDLFAGATGVASIITFPDGTPVTESSNFCRLCMEVIRKTPKGLSNCIKSDSFIGRLNSSGPIISVCLSGGLWDAGVSISVDELHLGNWLIGQVKNEQLDYSRIVKYAEEIDADPDEFANALQEVHEMPVEKFTAVANMLYEFVRDLTDRAHAIYLLKKEIQNSEKISSDLKKKQAELLEIDHKLKIQNNDYLTLNEELRQSNLELNNTLEKLKQSQLALIQQNASYHAINEELNQTNEEYHALIEELNQKNEEYYNLNEEIKLTNSHLQSTMVKLDESNQRNLSLLAAIPDMMFLFSHDDIFLDCHFPSGVKPFIPVEEFINKRIQEVMPADIVEEHVKARTKVLQTGILQTYQYLHTVNNQTRLFESSMVKYSGDKVLAIVRDISEQKKNRELEQEILVARKSVEFKQRFLANMSHEIRTPLTGMLGLADILTNTTLDETQRLYVEHLRQSGENLRHIINLILDYSKIESGQVNIKPVAFNTETLFDSAVSLFSSISDKPITLKKEISHRMPASIITDQYRLNQILNNLVSNAVKFTEKGVISLKANVQKETYVSGKKSRVTIRVDVSDTGIGIKPEMHKFLFRPFSQIDNSEMRSVEGTGLGLSICRELSSLLGGEIGMDSQEGKGSNFWFTFMADVAEIKAEEKSEVNNQRKTSAAALKILLVEDKKVNQLVVSLILKELGHTVDLARNGREAYENHNPLDFDLILMDIQMPVMDGITATNKLKEKYRKLPPIVGLSANAFEGDREKYMSLGMDDYITKPVKGEDFNELIKRLGLR